MHCVRIFIRKKKETEVIFLKSVKTIIKDPWEYVKSFGKWILCAVVVGIFGGVVGSLFHMCVDYVTHVRIENNWLLYLLPVGGALIFLLYGIFKKFGALDTDRVLASVSKDNDVPFVMAPLIFISASVSHLLGASVGREGAALQLGGAIGYRFAKALKMSKESIHTIVRAGMSAVFSALFGTPLAAAVFALEVVSVGSLPYGAMVPCFLSSATAFLVSTSMGVAPVRFLNVSFPALSPNILFQVLVLAGLCALVSILFCISIEKCKEGANKLLPNPYLRGLVGGGVILILTLLVGTRDYNGAGMDVISKALSGDARIEAFLLKILFTAVSISAGFKGGEIVPAFFVGATFGCAFGSLLGLGAQFGAAIGFVSVFCGAVNCPLASILLGIEVFGAEGALPIALACAVSFMLSGRYSLYQAQSFLYSKLKEEKLH